MRGKKLSDVRECVMQYVAPKPEQVTIDGLTFVIHDDKAWLYHALCFVKPPEEVIEMMRPVLEPEMQRAATLEAFRQEMMRVPQEIKQAANLPETQPESPEGHTINLLELYHMV